MKRKEDTPERIVRRRYEERHKEERGQKNKVWGTSIEREFAEEIDAFRKEHGLKKVELIYEGYNALVKHYGKQNE